MQNSCHLCVDRNNCLIRGDLVSQCKAYAEPLKFRDATIKCDKCGEVFQYREPDYPIVPADYLPDGYFIGGSWVCDKCGSCRCCGQEALDTTSDLCYDCERNLCPIGEKHESEVTA